MNKILLASASSLALISAAAAADMPVRPVKALPPVATIDWQGFYLGVNGGAVRHHAEIEWSFPGFSDAGGFTEFKGTFGGQIGANWQSQSIVYGIEADLNRVNAQGSATTTTLGLATFVGELSWLATVRGRAGVLIAPPTLAYVTGGLALGRVEGNWFNNSLVENKTRAGWVIGAGVEHVFAPRWSAKAEVLYADLGSTRTTGAGYVGRFSHTAWLGRVGLNLHW